MLGAMLIGAWLLIHQCCALGEKESKLRNSLLVEQLTRRSNLENNFMRFGRSSGFSFEREEMTDTNLLPNEVKRVRDSSNYFRLGRAKTMRDNFIRFGKRDEQTFKNLDELNLKFTPVPDNEEFNRAIKASDSFRRGFEDFNRPLRAKTDFMRLGRSYAGGSNDDSVKYKQNLKLRFGRDTDMNRDVRGRTDFMRFGRTSEEHDGISAIEGNKDIKRLGKVSNGGEKTQQNSKDNTYKLCADGEEGEEQSEKKVCLKSKIAVLDAQFRRSLPSPFQPGFILGPELTLLPPIYFKHPNENTVNNLMRLG